MKFYAIKFEGHERPVGFYIDVNPEGAEGSSYSFVLDKEEDHLFVTAYKPEAEKVAREEGAWYLSYQNPYAGLKYEIIEIEL